MEYFLSNSCILTEQFIIILEVLMEKPQSFINLKLNYLKPNSLLKIIQLTHCNINSLINQGKVNFMNYKMLFKKNCAQYVFLIFLKFYDNENNIEGTLYSFQNLSI